MRDEEKLLGNLTNNARDHLENAIKVYKEKLLREAIAIEELEHTGQGPPEITAAHIEEARWVTIRRIRHSIRGGWLLTLSRVAQFIAAIVAGIGGSNLSRIWGAITALVAISVGCGFFIIERHIIGRE